MGTPSLLELRQSIERLDAAARESPALPFGIAALDSALPRRGLTLGAVHEISESGPRGHYAANAILFAAGILARLHGPVLWCLHSRDLFAPALARVGLHPDRIIFCEMWRDKEILPALEEGLCQRGFAGVVGELDRLPLTPSRRLQLAAEGSGVTALIVRRSSANIAEANAAHTRWRISAAPSDFTEPIGMGRKRWLVELMRCRGAEPNSWVLEACDAKGYLHLPSELADRPAAAGSRRAVA